MTEFELQGERLLLLPQRALYWPRERTLLVADVHFGKAAAFRAEGVPVPQGTTTENLAKLDALIESHAAARIVFLGDFLHAKASHAPATLAALRRWRAHRRDLELVLVRGNHDVAAGDPPAELGVTIVNEPLTLGPFALRHHPAPYEGYYVLAGHLHPSFHVDGRAGDGVRVPCFWFNHAVGVLPAFGSFTGTHAIDPAENDRVFLVTPDRVFPMSA